MKRTVVDVLRRGFDNVIANWQLLLLRFGEAVLLAIIVIGAIVAAIIPVVVSAGLGKFDIGNPNSAAELLVTLVMEHWMLLLYLFLLVFLILGVAIGIHSFVEAGSARVYIDGERTPGMRAFTFDRWLKGGREGWWVVFWIYNLAWSVAALILLVPAVITLAGTLLVTQTAGRVAIGCAGLALIVLLMIPTAIVIGIWTQKAIAICVARALGAMDALRAARREIKLDFGRHLAVAVVVLVMSFIAAGLVSSFSIPLSIGSHTHRVSFAPLFFAPMQIMLSVVQNALSMAVGAWYLASFVALTEER